MVDIVDADPIDVPANKGVEAGEDAVQGGRPDGDDVWEIASGSGTN